MSDVGGRLDLEVISGGQTGVDRAALDVALALGLPCGGFCPRGRRAEDGRIPARYPLEETASDHYPERTERNVRRADATLVLAHGTPRRGSGTSLTVGLARRTGTPWILVDPRDPGAAATIRGWLDEHAVRVLNVAGPRESECPGIHAETVAVLRRVFGGESQASTST